MEPYPNDYILPSCRCIWGGYSIVDIELHGIWELMNISGDMKDDAHISKGYPKEVLDIERQMLNCIKGLGAALSRLPLKQHSEEA